MDVDAPQDTDVEMAAAIEASMHQSASKRRKRSSEYFPLRVGLAFEKIKLASALDKLLETTQRDANRSRTKMRC